jgi:hypothetical protein
MSDSDGSHSCQDTLQELIKDELDDPEPRRLHLAAGDMNGWCSICLCVTHRQARA